MKKHFKFLFLAMATISLVSCGEDKPFKDYDRSETGVIYKIHNSEGDTTRANVGDVMVAQMRYTNDKDSVFSTSESNKPMEFKISEPAYDGGLFQGLMLLGMGDSATFVISTDSFFMKTVGQPIPPYLDSASFFFVNVKVDTIITADQLFQLQQERALMMKEMSKVKMEQAITQGLIKAEPNEKGIYVETVKKGTGTAVETGKYAKINLRFGAVGSQPVQDSWNAGEPQHFYVGAGRLGMGFEEVLAGLKVGSHVKIMVPSELGFGEQGAGGIDPYSPMMFEVEILKIMTEEQVMEEYRTKENTDRLAFLKKEGISTTATADGLFVKELQKGNGASAEAGKQVHVHYTGTFLDGRKFDSSLDHGQPYSFILGQGAVIPGWDMAVSTMKEGDKWVVVIPSKMAYGEMGSQNGIPPFSTLVFEMELIKVDL